MKLLSALTSLAFVLILITSSVLAQESTETVISIRIVNEQLENVNNAYVKNSLTNRIVGVSSEGVVNFESGEQNLYLSISHISYQDKEIQITNTIAKDTIRATVQLVIEDFLIEQVKVNSAKTSLAYLNEKVNVSDYEFYNDVTVLLSKIGSRSQLRLMDKVGNDIHYVNIPRRAKGLERDCFNNLHVIYRDSCIQLNLDADTIRLEKRNSLVDYQKTLGFCEASIGNDFVIAYTSSSEIDKHFYLKREVLSNYIHIRDIRNTTSPTWCTYVNSLAPINVRRKALSESSTSDSEEGLPRNIDAENFFYNSVVKRPVYAPVFKISNKLFLLDHHANQIAQISMYSGKLKHISSIYYQYDKWWKSQVIQDYDKEDLYALFKKRGKYFLKQLNVKNGTLKQEIYVDKHQFIENMKIKDGYLYYLYREMYNSGMPSKLFKFQLN